MSVDVHHVTVLICLEVTVAQQIRISGVEANGRIERAIPKFMSRFGMQEDQATAVAIRLESLGRLKDDGAPVNKPANTKGLPIPVTPYYITAALQNMMRQNQPRRTIVVEPSDEVYDSAYTASTSASVSSNRLRTRVTRGK